MIDVYVNVIWRRPFGAEPVAQGANHDPETP